MRTTYLRECDDSDRARTADAQVLPTRARRPGRAWRLESASARYGMGHAHVGRRGDRCADLAPPVARGR